ncbi:MAG TPA: ATP-grasp domain-containing protein [Gemmataceae bacterium]|nr:ATP-grasp domain-containing protein [Gemmataceae bacterium]
MNVLLTSAGRRSYLVRFFKEALRGRGQVIACDCSKSAPALAEADCHFLVPPTDAPAYLDVLLSICRSQEVRLVLAVNDLELPDLAREASRFHAVGTMPVVSSPQLIATCQDKWAAFRWLRERGIATPETYLSLDDARQALAGGALDFPLLLKPRCGSSSVGVERVETERELALAYEWGQVQLRRGVLSRLSPAGTDNSLVIQQWHRGQEYGLDVVNDLQGVYRATLARRKLAMRAGNTDRAMTVADPALEQLGRDLGNRLQHVGCLDCDVLATDSGYLVLDLNPRLGGGYPFSHLAGANVPAALVAWAGGQEADSSWLRAEPYVVVSKYDSVTIMSRGVLDPRAIRHPEVVPLLLRESPQVVSVADGPAAVTDCQGRSRES